MSVFNRETFMLRLLLVSSRTFSYPPPVSPSHFFIYFFKRFSTTTIKVGEYLTFMEELSALRRHTVSEVGDHYITLHYTDKLDAKFITNHKVYYKSQNSRLPLGRTETPQYWFTAVLGLAGSFLFSFSLNCFLAFLCLCC